MENATHRRLVLFPLLHVFSLLCITTHLGSTTPPTASSTSSRFGNETDRLALLDLKNSITKDPLQAMSSWNDSVPFCSWIGVTCNPSTKRVVILNLIDQQLAGSIPPSIGNFTHLTGINLGNNRFQGEIPQEMGRLRSLRHLNLSTNSFGGKIPTNISHCTRLTVLDLYSNNLIGSIPNQLSSLLNLQILNVDTNNLIGHIPSWIGNFSSLRGLYLGENNFQGSIPSELGRLTSLGSFVLAMNNLSGTIPSSIYNISSIGHFSVTDNQLHGELPQNVGITLPNLEYFAAGKNHFTGVVPASLSNASRLQVLSFGANSLTGPFPAEYIGRLQSLVGLGFGSNSMGSGETGDLNFLNFLANCTNLVILGIDDNNFGGELPASIANLSTNLQKLYLGSNLIQGSIPIEIGNLVNLTILVLEHNYLGSRVPDAIGKLQKLVQLYLNDNHFSGPIPPSLGMLTSLTNLYLQGNWFEGSIPPSLGYSQNLLLLNLSSNNLTGHIPKELFGLSSLSVSLSLSNNFLSGSLPSNIGELVHLTELDVSGNNLSGEIPTTIGDCIMLQRLHLEANEFQGLIPQSLEELNNMEEIDFSRNNFTGQIPEFLGKLPFLKHLNLSQNNFEGELPKEGVFSNVSGLSILRNYRLCGGIPQLLLPPCNPKKHHSSHRLLSQNVVIPTACALAFIVALSCIILARSMVKKSRGGYSTSHSYKDWKTGVSYSELVRATNGFSIDNLVGSGSFGSVYKGVLPLDGTLVAVKVLNLQQQRASKSFIDECRALRSIRHRNLLKIITACSSIDNNGNDFKSLVFKYMTNGSLDLWLHPRDDNKNSQTKRLSFVERLSISIDVASSLDYLHNHCETTIVHCDLKPSNVLLDDDMVAHVGDFGLAKFLLEASDNPSESQTVSAGLKGTVGYIPPEYGIGGQVSVHGDVYSYGILLLEMFTGKRPTNDMFGEGLSIHQYAALAVPDHIMDIADPSLLAESEDGDSDYGRDGNDIQERASRRYEDGCAAQARRLDECLVCVMQIGLSCSAISPGDRLLMDVVVNKMMAIRDSFLNVRKQG